MNNNLQPIEYFLDAEDKYIADRKGELEFYYDEGHGMQPLNINDPLAFLDQNLFHKTYKAMLTKKQEILGNLSYDTIDSELLMVVAYEGFMSQYFRDDYYGKEEIPPLVREMQKCLYSIIGKAPIFDGKVLYRFCNWVDKVDFQLGDEYKCLYSLATTKDNWNQDTHRYIITPLPKNKTKARSLFEIYNHGNENQVNFLPNASFIITEIKTMLSDSITYKHIYMSEI